MLRVKKITGTITTKAAQTYTPTTSNQTIASGTYLTGTQTIKGDANLVASNIKSGVSIFGVSGTYEGSGGSSGGGSVETCSVMITTDAPAMGTATAYYIDENGAIGSKAFKIMSGTSVSVAKNTIMSITPWTSMTSISGDCSTLMSSQTGGSFIINGDSTIVYSG